MNRVSFAAWLVVLTVSGPLFGQEEPRELKRQARTRVIELDARLVNLRDQLPEGDPRKKMDQAIEARRKAQEALDECIKVEHWSKDNPNTWFSNESENRPVSVQKARELNDLEVAAAEELVKIAKILRELSGGSTEAGWKAGCTQEAALCEDLARSLLKADRGMAQAAITKLSDRLAARAESLRQAYQAWRMGNVDPYSNDLKGFDKQVGKLGSDFRGVDEATGLDGRHPLEGDSPEQRIGKLPPDRIVAAMKRYCPLISDAMLKEHALRDREFDLEKKYEKKSPPLDFGEKEEVRLAMSGVGKDAGVAVVVIGRPDTKRLFEVRVENRSGRPYTLEIPRHTLVAVLRGQDGMFVEGTRETIADGETKVLDPATLCAQIGEAPAEGWIGTIAMRNGEKDPLVRSYEDPTVKDRLATEGCVLISAPEPLREYLKEMEGAARSGVVEGSPLEETDFLQWTVWRMQGAGEEEFRKVVLPQLEKSEAYRKADEEGKKELVRKYVTVPFERVERIAEKGEEKVRIKYTDAELKAATEPPSIRIQFTKKPGGDK